MDVVVLGCGPSSGIPTLRCVVRGTCAVCSEAHADLDSKNRRLNPSLLVRNRATQQNVLIDCGKTFREGVLRWFPSLGIQYVDSVVLTHGHADACMGLDDLREVQRNDVQVRHGAVISSAMDVHCSAETHRTITDKFDYLVEHTNETEPEHLDNDAEHEVDGNGHPTRTPVRWVAQLRLQDFTWFQPFQACGLTFVPLPVLHGADYTSAAFEFGQEVGKRFVYMSDVSTIPDNTRAYLQDPQRPRIDVLMIDALRIEHTHPTHMSLKAALNEVEAIRPKRTLLTGMGHDFDYATTSTMLIKWSATKDLEVRMAYDGLRIMYESMR